LADQFREIGPFQNIATTHSLTASSQPFIFLEGWTAFHAAKSSLQSSAISCSGVSEAKGGRHDALHI
jgi:hypothetical protein